MNNENGYETLEEVHKAYTDWEQQKKAWNFGFELWCTAVLIIQNEIGEDSDLLIGEQKHVNMIFETLHQGGSLKKCLTDDFRRLVIQYHARNYSTTKAIETILSDDTMKDITPFHFLKHSNICGYENIMEYLVSRLSYLKPSHPRWSEKKYGDFWKKERSEYVDQIKDIPLTHPLEQLTELSEHYQSLKALYEKTTDIKDKERLHKCMMQTHTHIYLISRDPSLNAIPTELTQERKTQALPKPDDSNIIDLQTQDVSPQLQTVGEKKGT